MSDFEKETESFEVTTEDVPTVEVPAVEASAESATENKVPGEENPAAADNAEDPVETAEEPAGETEVVAKDDKPKKPARLQKRIDKVVREREQAKRENEKLQARIKELEGKSESTDKEPVETDFDNYDDFLDALDAYDAKQEKSGKTATPKEDTSTQDKPAETAYATERQKEAMAVLRESFDNAELPKDFKDVVFNPELPVTGEMVEALAECDDPSKVMYHLGQNKELAEEIAGKSPVQQMRAITKLEMEIGNKPPKPVQSTSAPDPISPVNGSDAQRRPVEKMSFAEYEKTMNRREQERQSNRW